MPRRTGKSGKAAELYAKRPRGRDSDHAAPDEPLLYVPTHPARDIREDLAAAGLNDKGPGGKVDFHALRTAYVTLLLHTDAGLKEAQSLARHSTPDLTFNVYGRTREDRLARLAEAVGEAVLPVESIAYAQRKAAGAESLCPPSTSMVRAEGLEPSTYGLKGRCSTD